MNIPVELKYTADHEWVRIEGNTAFVGITDFAQRELGDIVFVDINTVGKEIKSGEIFGTVEAVKTVSDLFIPIAGTVLEVNAHLDANPESVNTDPYGDGWMIKMQIANDADVATLMTADAYSATVA